MPARNSHRFVELMPARFIALSARSMISRIGLPSETCTKTLGYRGISPSQLESRALGYVQQIGCFRLGQICGRFNVLPLAPWRLWRYRDHQALAELDSGRYSRLLG